MVGLAVAFLVLVVPVVGFGEYQRYSSLKDLSWGFKEKDVMGSSVPDIVFNWVPEQNKIVMDFPIRVENPRDFDVVFSKVDFDVSLWGLESGGGVISQRHVVPAKSSRTLWIRNFEISVKDFENFVFTVATTGQSTVDIDISLRTYYPLLNTDVESGGAVVEADYPLEREIIKGVVEKKLRPFIGG